MHPHEQMCRLHCVVCDENYIVWHVHCPDMLSRRSTLKFNIGTLKTPHHRPPPSDSTPLPLAFRTYPPKTDRSTCASVRAYTPRHLSAMIMNAYDIQFTSSYLLCHLPIKLIKLCPLPLNATPSITMCSLVRKWDTQLCHKTIEVSPKPSHEPWLMVDAHWYDVLQEYSPEATTD
jgi:hypothetical protein